MQIQNNYQQSPNFGMSMILKSGSRRAIEKGGAQLIESIKKAGEIVGDTKLVHLSIGHDAIPLVETPYAGKYMRYFEAEEPTVLFPEFLNVNTVWAGSEVNGHKIGSKYKACIEMENASAAAKAYREMKNAKNEVERGAILTRILDDKYSAQQALTNAEFQNKKALKSEVDKLFEQYGEKIV